MAVIGPNVTSIFGPPSLNDRQKCAELVDGRWADRLEPRVAIGLDRSLHGVIQTLGDALAVFDHDRADLVDAHARHERVSALQIAGIFSVILQKAPRQL